MQAIHLRIELRTSPIMISSLLPKGYCKIAFHIPGPDSVWVTTPAAAISVGCHALCVGVLDHLHGVPLLADGALLLGVVDLLHPDQSLTPCY